MSNRTKIVAIFMCLPAVGHADQCDSTQASVPGSCITAAFTDGFTRGCSAARGVPSIEGRRIRCVPPETPGPIHTVTMHGVSLRGLSGFEALSDIGLEVGQFSVPNPSVAIDESPYGSDAFAPGNYIILRQTLDRVEASNPAATE